MKAKIGQRWRYVDVIGYDYIIEIIALNFTNGIVKQIIKKSPYAVGITGAFSAFPGSANWTYLEGQDAAT